MKNEIKETNNIATIIGRVSADPVFSHEIEGEKFMETIIEVKRLSDTYDYIPVTFSDRLIEIMPRENDYIAINGEFRSYNKQENDKSKLILHVFAKELYREEDFGLIDMNNTNNVTLTGYICKDPIYRVTPFKREICDALIAVNRRNFKSDYIPCIFWGRNARFMEGQEVGKKVSIEGRIQSRIYTKKLEDGSEEQRTAYEVSVQKMFEVYNEINVVNEERVRV